MRKRNPHPKTVQITMHYSICYNCIGFQHVHKIWFMHLSTVCVCVHYAHRTTDETKIYWKCVASCKMKMSWIYSLWWILNCILGINATQWLISSALSGIQPARERKRRPTNRMHGKRGDKTGELKMFVILRPVKNEFCRLNMSWTHIYCTMQMCHGDNVVHAMNEPDWHWQSAIL